jgi:hypothetical protein
MPAELWPILLLCLSNRLFIPAKNKSFNQHRKEYFIFKPEDVASTCFKTNLNRIAGVSEPRYL